MRFRILTNKTKAKSTKMINNKVFEAPLKCILLDTLSFL